MSASARHLRVRAAAVIAGAAVMVIEVLGTRIIGPHFGVGLFVWTALITVALVALAAGSFVGGTLADRYPTTAALAKVLLAAAAAVALIPLLRRPLLAGAGAFGLRGGSLVAATTLFFPSLLLLGMVSPFAVRLEGATPEEAGRSAGRIYALSTAGSVLGALLAGFVLVPSLRIPTVLGLLAASLAGAALLALGKEGLRRRAGVGAAAVLVGAAAFAWPRERPHTLIDARTSGGTDLRVVDLGADRYLLADGVIQTHVDAERRCKAFYPYLLTARALMLRPGAKDAVIVGLGGGAMVPLLEQHGVLVEGVELSPEVEAMARAHFGLALPPERTHVADGRAFLTQRPGRYDLVVLDVFTGERLPFSLVSREGFETARAALRPGGLLAMNTLAIVDGRPTATAAALRRTLRAVFAHALAVPATTNVLFFASDAPLTPQRQSLDLQTFEGPRTLRWSLPTEPAWPEAPLLTDDWNRIDSIDLAEAERTRADLLARAPALVRDALLWE